MNAAAPGDCTGSAADADGHGRKSADRLNRRRRQPLGLGRRRPGSGRPLGSGGAAQRRHHRRTPGGGAVSGAKKGACRHGSDSLAIDVRSAGDSHPRRLGDRVPLL